MKKSKFLNFQILATEVPTTTAEGSNLILEFFKSNFFILATTIDPLQAIILNVMSQLANLQLLRDLVLAQTQISGHEPCYDQSLNDLDFAIATINAVLPLMATMTVADAQTAANTVGTLNMNLLANLTSCNLMAGWIKQKVYNWINFEFFVRRKKIF